MIEDWLALATAIAIALGAAFMFALAVETATRYIARRSEWARNLATHARKPFWVLTLVIGLWVGARIGLSDFDWIAAVSQVFTLYDLRCFVRETMVLYVQGVMPDAVPAQRVLIAEPARARVPKRGTRASKAEAAGDSGLFSGSAEAEERASEFQHGQARESHEDAEPRMELRAEGDG